MFDFSYILILYVYDTYLKSSQYKLLISLYIFLSKYAVMYRPGDERGRGQAHALVADSHDERNRDFRPWTV